MAIDVSLRHLRAFLAVAEQGSFTRAAQALGRTQSTLTATLQELEAALGVALLRRSTRRVEVTPEGEEFARLAARVVREFDAAMADMRALSTLQRGRVSIAAAPSVATLVLPEVLRRFSSDHPGIRLSVADVSSREAERQVLSGRADFGYTSRWSDGSDLLFRPLLADAFGVVFQKSHRLAEGIGPLPWSELAGERCVGLAEDTGIKMILRHAPGLPEAVTNPFYEASTTTSLDMMVAGGLGVAVLPALAAARAPISKLGFRVLTEPSATRTVGLITSASRPLSPAAARCLEHVAAAAKTVSDIHHVMLIGPKPRA
jgi:DNA-binding transcriptional LysR family regulator